MQNIRIHFSHSQRFQNQFQLFLAFNISRASASISTASEFVFPHFDLGSLLHQSRPKFLIESLKKKIKTRTIKLLQKAEKINYNPSLFQNDKLLFEMIVILSSFIRLSFFLRVVDIN